MELQIINEQEVLGKEFKVYGTPEEPLFMAKDVAEWIDYSFKDNRKVSRDVSKMLNTVDEEEKVKNTINLGGEDYSHGGIRTNTEMWFLTENGLYEVLMQSRKPIAKAFKKEVKLILKSIRQHGAYMTPQTIEDMLTSPEMIIGLATKLKDEQAVRKDLEAKLVQQKPKVLFAEALEVSDSSCLIGALAKILKQNGVEIGQKRLFDWMREKGYLIKQKGEEYNTPTQKSMNLKLFEVKITTINNPDGSVRTTRTTKVTAKGQIYFVNKFLTAEAI